MLYYLLGCRNKLVDHWAGDFPLLSATRCNNKGLVRVSRGWYLRASTGLSVLFSTPVWMISEARSQVCRVLGVVIKVKYGILALLWMGLGACPRDQTLFRNA